jgi:hypothetical protein
LGDVLISPYHGKGSDNRLTRFSAQGALNLVYTILKEEIPSMPSFRYSTECS